MRIAVQGCAHGELELIYNMLEELEKNDDKKIDLLICCGDFQSTRNFEDLASMAVPDKYKDICTFYKYYSGEKVAPVLTLFIGGNHEASNYLQELPYGGWVAPKIYYMGYASVLTIGGLRIAGVSGIYKSQDFLKGHFELPPYDASTIRSIYHTRNLEIFRLKQLTGNIDIFITHDWPNGVTKFGNEEELVKRKPFFKSDIEGNNLGSPSYMELLKQHYPKFWFSAHLHCKFAAFIPSDDKTRTTKFLALDKCLPKRRFLQILEVPHDCRIPMTLSYDLEWLTVLYLTNHLLSVKNSVHYMPGQGCVGRWNFTPTDSEKQSVLSKFMNCLEIPENFERTVEAYNPKMRKTIPQQAQLRTNKQTTVFCDKLGIDDPSLLLQLMNPGIVNNQNSKDDPGDTLKSPSNLYESFESYEDEITSEPSVNTSLKNVLEIPQEDEHELSTQDEESKGNLSTVEPNTKKFKRRNQAIYEGRG